MPKGIYPSRKQTQALPKETRDGQVPEPVAPWQPTIELEKALDTYWNSLTLSHKLWVLSHKT
jgi:hypothetical protein